MHAIAQPFIPPDVSDPPFLPAADTVLDIPVPPSVNDTHMVRWAARPRVKLWKEEADALLMISGQYRRARKDLVQYELTIILNERLCHLDQDNAIKAAIDYLRRIKLIKGDCKKYGRRTIIEWGNDTNAPAGCRLILRSVAA